MILISDNIEVKIEGFQMEETILNSKLLSSC